MTLTHPTSKSAARVLALGMIAALLSAAPPALAIVAEQLAEGVVRFHASESDRIGAEPSVALARVMVGVPIDPAGHPQAPTFDQIADAWRVTIPVAPGTSLYGTGMVVGPLERTGQRTEIYTLDAFAYGDHSRRLYQAHPWIMGVRADGTSFGVIFDSTWRSAIDTTDPINAGIVFLTEGPAPPVIVIDQPTPQDVLRRLAELTGNPTLMPRWAIGFHQSRYQYTPQSEVLDIANGFRLREIPADVMHIDVEYMNGYRVFTFDPQTFPDPAGLDASLDAIGFQTVWNVSPTIKVEEANPLYTYGRDNDLFVKLADGITDFIGQGFPGDSAWVDYTRADARLWFAGQYAHLAVIGADGIWTDLNEPSVFEVPPTYDMPQDNTHHADPALGGDGPHLKYRNTYGMQSARTAFEGMVFAKPHNRPFVLTRSNYLGGQRYAATWTGDNTSTEYHLGLSVPMTLTLGLSGQPYSGPDIGGFALEATSALYARWIGLGALLPFARGHSLIAESEPWSYGGDAEYTARLAITRRYRLLPYLDGLFFEAHAFGLPVARPLFFADPTDPALRTVQDSFLLGDAIVVATAPALGESPTLPPLNEPLRRFGLPISADPEADLDTDHPDLPHLYLRPGHIVPLGPLMQHTGDRPLDDLTLIVALDDRGFALGLLFEDAGDGWGLYNGEFRYTAYSAWQQGDVVQIRLEGAIGNRPAIARPLHVRVLGADGIEYRASGIDGQLIEVDISQPPGAPASDPAAIDGRRIPDAFGGSPPVAIGASGPASNTPGVLGALYASTDATAVRLGLTGVSRYDNAATVVLLDYAAGGPAQLAPQFAGAPDALGVLAGARFDTGFTPDATLVVDTTGGGLWTFLVTFNPDGTVASSQFLGRGVAAEGTGELRSGQNPAGVRIALDNGATAGSPPPGRAALDPATLGVELHVPWLALGLGGPPGAPIRCAVFAVQRDPASIDHMLPDTGIGGFPIPAGPDLTAIQGDQFIELPTGARRATTSIRRAPPRSASPADAAATRLP